MQRTVASHGTWASLTERLEHNRHALQHMAEQLGTVLTDVRERRRRTAHLLGEAEQLRVSVSEFRAALLAARRTDTAGSPVLPRYRPTEPNPLDEVRRKLHEAYFATGDPRIRAELLVSYDGFARSLALKFRHRESVDDLVQVARIGLLHA